MLIDGWTHLSADEEKALARRIVAAEKRARALIADLDCVQDLLNRKGKGSERTRAGQVNRLGEAIELVWQQRKTSPQLGKVARHARAAWAEAETLRWELAMSGRRIAHGEARKLKAANLDQADLTQEGYVGLLRAAKRFDPDREIRFGTYARWWVRAQMTRAIDQHGRMVRLPGGAVEQLRNLRKAIKEYETAGAPWAITDIAAQAGIEAERAEFLLSRKRALSLDEPLDNEAKSRSVSDLLTDEGSEDPEASVGLTEELRRMTQAMTDVLDERQRWVVARRFGLEDGNPRSLSEIARGMKLSRERVRQIERQALQLLRSRGHIREMAA
ncbi:MAG: sigma-70 family RNA polymerase sigma factor [Myxococcales bacterium]|nr:sigma-70 family RNA polymerase sigma factor [Myxococcales bacterium]